MTRGRSQNWKRGSRRGAVLNTGSLPQPGKPERLGPRTYRYRGTGKPDGAKRYTIDGTEHRFDGKCHADCPDVR
jgi:hypothetical protein